MYYHVIWNLWKKSPGSSEMVFNHTRMKRPSDTKMLCIDNNDENNEIHLKSWKLSICPRPLRKNCWFLKWEKLRQKWKSSLSTTAVYEQVINRCTLYFYRKQTISCRYPFDDSCSYPLSKHLQLFTLIGVLLFFFHRN